MSEEASRKRKADEASCPYLDTIERTLLDFDLEPICSVSLEKGPHLYACLVCGKYFRGKGSQTPAYTHSVEDSHYVFIHLGSSEIFCLPDNYQVHDASLDDIKDALSPSYAKQQVQVIDQQSELSRDLFGRRYLPGFVGLNDLHNGINAVVQALSHVPSLRDYFLLHPVLPECTKDSAKAAHHVAVAFGELVRQIWSRHRIKGTVDPHRLVQAIVAASGKRFQMGVQVEVGELLTWLLHQLHVGTGGTHKKGSIVQRTFQGKVRVTTRQAKAVEKKQIGQEDDRLGSDDEAGPLPDVTMDDEKVEIEETVSDTQFMQLALDIPEKPLFRDEDGGLVIPQEPYSNLLKKFDGITFSDAISRSGTAQRKRYQILKLPNYLILHLSRFSTNQYSREKNPTIVAFPVKNFDLGSYVHREEKIELPTPDEVRSMSVRSTRCGDPTGRR